MFVHEGKCVHVGLSQDLINSGNGRMHLHTGRSMHTSLVLDEDFASSKAEFFTE